MSFDGLPTVAGSYLIGFFAPPGPNSLKEKAPNSIEGGFKPEAPRTVPRDKQVRAVDIINAKANGLPILVTLLSNLALATSTPNLTGFDHGLVDTYHRYP